MADLAEFLLERIAEDEEVTRGLQRRAQEHELDCRDPRLLGTVIPGWGDWPRVQVMCVHLLADCVVKRRVLARHAPYFIKGYEPEPPICDYCEGAPDWPCSEVLDIASVYADHPGFCEEWRP